MASLHSPKNRYRVEINFTKPVKGIGSVVSFTADSIEQLKAYSESQVHSAYVNATASIYENKETYPQFDWSLVENYNIKAE